MNALARWNQSRWNQLSGLEGVQPSLGSLFSHSRVQWPKGQESQPQWIPLVEVSENAEEYLVKADLPQVKQEDVKITLEEGTVTITGDRHFDQNSKKDHRIEHAYGRFAHSFVLPVDARPAEISALFKNGVLIVHLAKNRSTAGRSFAMASSSPL